MKAKVLKYIEQYRLISAGDSILVGVSGGADSLALLYFLKSQSATYGITLAAAHLHHGLRGDEADHDAKVVEEFCHSLSIPLFTRRVDVREIAAKKKMTLEEAGRTARYAFFKEIVREHGFSKIALGHHMNDQAETVMMRLIRGTGIGGAAGIRPVSQRDDMLLIRPLLSVSKEEILSYCHVEGIIYCTDSTNLEVDAVRNQLRLEIIPKLEAINPGVQQHLSEFAALAAEYEAVAEHDVDELERNIFQANQRGVTADIKALNDIPAVLQYMLIRRGIARARGSLKDIGQKHIAAIEHQLSKDQTTWKIDLPGVVIRRNYKMLHIEKSGLQQVTFGCYPVYPGQDLYLPDEGFIVHTAILNKNSLKNVKESKNHSEKYFDYGKIRGKLYIRGRRPGDYFKPVGQNGRKKIKDYLIDRKVDRERRDRIPMLAEGERILWIFGYAIDREYRVDTQSDAVLWVCFEKIQENEEL